MDLLRCPSCNMTFKSSLLLEKHRQRFCIGGDIGRVRETRTPQEMIERLGDYKRKKEEQKRQHTLQEHKHLEENEEKDSNAQGPLVDSSGIGKNHIRQTRRSPKAEWARDHEAQLRYLAEAHRKQVNDILAQNKQLEKQRDDIVERLNELAAQNRNSAQLETLLMHLNAQEQRNEQLLTSMKQQIEVLQMESMRNRNQSRPSDYRSQPDHQKEKVLPVHHQQAYLPFYGGGNLTSEISALRAAYLQSGGSDQVILAHLQDLYAEAQQMEQRERRAKYLRKKNKKVHVPARSDFNMEILTLEIENQRLEDEIMRLQFKRQKSVRVSKTSPVEKERIADVPTFLRAANTRQKMRTLNTELDLLKQELEIQRLRRRMKTTGAHEARPQPYNPTLPPLEEIKPLTPPIARRFLDANDDLGPAPYDPIAGFVVFYDFLLGLDPSYHVCRLVVGLYSGGLEMGSPSPLPPVYCEMGNMAAFPENKRRNAAILATKQSVPRVRPSPTISLVIELQASGGYDQYGQEVNRLVARGWVKIDIFDYQNRVISGQWRVPVRVLPVKASLTTGEMNGVPQLDNAELYIRIVNARDAEVQSINSIETKNAVFYRYPPLTAARNFTLDPLHPSSYYSNYDYATAQMRQPTFEEIVDPPPPAQMMSSQ
ncbi:coiled-coil domain-containing protein 17-like [Ambystoma mexicanum]|uniref:coiled-coil domain-containing protein 17-like n=1 Tax=Ambystoma mexicanum TaxID=8296 RepID=UPI0037E85C03